MNALNNLSLADVAKLLACLQASGAPPEAPTAVQEAAASAPIGVDFIGKYVIVRCRDAGVHAGFLREISGRSCVLTDSRRLWYWKVNGGGDFLNAIALDGIHKSSKLSAETPLVMLTENCEILVCSNKAAKSIQEQVVFNG